ncbi:DNA repair protein RecO [bacterium]|nr:DNA repair protein RecO [bacterium]
MSETVFGSAIVLHRRRLDDNSDVLLLLSPKWGRVNAVCSGLQKSGSALRGKVEPFTEFEGLFVKGSGSMWRLTQAKALRMRLELCSDYNCICWGSYLLELFSRAVEGEDLPSPASGLDYRLFYRILNEALDALICFPQKGVAVSVWVLLKVLKILGIEPALTGCCRCEEKTAAGFSHEAGGTVCRSCFGSYEDSYPLTLPALELLRYFSVSPLKKALASKHTAAAYAAAERLLWRHLSEYWNLHLKSRALLKIGERSIASFGN